MFTRRFLPVGWIVAIAVILAFLPVAAAGQSTPVATSVEDTGPRFVLRPADDVDGSYFSIEAAPGSTHTLDVVLGNADDEPLTLRAFVADAYTLVNGGFGVRPEDHPQTGVSTWIEYEPETLTLEPAEGVERSFTVTIPRDAEPGQYIAGIVLRTADSVAVSGSPIFEQIIRKSVAIFITVPGTVWPALDLGEPEVDTDEAGVRLLIPVRNVGNVLLRPTGSLTLTDERGEEIFTQAIAMGPIYARTDTRLDIPLPLELPDGTYQVSLTVSDDNAGVSESIPGEPITLDRAAESALAVTAVNITPLPDADNIQMAVVSVTVQNLDLPVAGVQVLLAVEHDGAYIEEFALASSVTLEQGETTLEQRYIPITGWASGEWTFSLTLRAIDQRRGTQVTLLEAPVDQSMTID